jgi:hypothetical protein
MFKGFLRAFAVPLITLFLLLIVAAAQAQPAHNHPPRDAAVHEKFYMGWDRPDFPGNNCCKMEDCYATPFKRIGGAWYALTRTPIKDEHGITTGDYELSDRDDPKNWIRIPPERLEQNQMPGMKAWSQVNHEEYTMREPLDSPDGRSHVCMIYLGEHSGITADAQSSHWWVLCAVLGEEG